jgi:signal peptidase
MGKLSSITNIAAISLAVLSGIALLGLSLPIGGWRPLSVRTGSMEPHIKTGSLVFVNRVSAESIKSGDVITYVNPSDKAQTITHRVQDVIVQSNGQRKFIAKGDANQTADQPVSENRVIGKVQAAVPYAGEYRNFVYTWPGLILLVYLPALIICIGEIRKLAAYYRSQHYILPEFLARRMKKGSGLAPSSLMVAGVIFFSTIAVALPVHAAKQSSATLTNFSISLAADETPEPEPELPRGNGEGRVSIRRVFISCGADGATHTVEVILYNSQFKDMDVSGWTIRSDGHTLIKFPGNSVIPARSIYESDGSKPDDISYPEGNLKLFDTADEQKDEQAWSPDVYASRECRFNP